MRLHYTLIADWPPLAWLARWHPRDDVLKGKHGPRGETHPDWVGEVAWAGGYTAGDFDRADLVFGSGARVRDGLVTFVSAGSTVDRLLSLEQPDLNRVSNSLPCLLADAGGSVDPADPDYFSAFRSISLGLDRYQKCLPTGAGRQAFLIAIETEADAAEGAEVIGIGGIDTAARIREEAGQRVGDPVQVRLLQREQPVNRGTGTHERHQPVAHAGP